MAGRKGKDLDYFKDIKITEIFTNQEVRDGTVEYYALWRYAKELVNSGSSKMWDRISKIQEINSTNYKEYFSTAYSGGMGRRTIMSKQQVDARKMPVIDTRDIEATIQNEITRGINDHGVQFLAALGMPPHGKLSWGVLDGTIMPVAIKPGKFYKRIIRYALDSQTMDPSAFKGGKDMQNQILEFIKDLQQRDAYYDAFFSGNYRYIPPDIESMNKHLNVVPNMSSGFKAFIGRRYGNFNFKQHTFGNHIFGFGKEYQDSVSLYREIQNVYGGDSSAYDTITQGLSRLNQLSMEAGYVDPISYAVLVDGFRSQLHGMGIGTAMKNGVDVHGRIVQGHEVFRSDPLFAMVQGAEGFSLDPIKMLSPYRTKNLRKFIKHAQDVMEIPNGGKSKIKDFFESNSTGCKW